MADCLIVLLFFRKIISAVYKIYFQFYLHGSKILKLLAGLKGNNVILDKIFDYEIHQHK